MWMLLLPVCVMLIHVPQGSALTSRTDDPDPLTATVQQQAQLITQLQARLNSLEDWKDKQEQRVAFNARLSRSISLTGNDVIKFDHADLNVGHGYDTLTGIFTAPVSGLYEFSLKITHRPPGHLHVHILKEQTIAAELEASDDNYNDRASADVALHITKGQRVWAARAVDSTATGFAGRHACTFMGILIQAD